MPFVNDKLDLNFSSIFKHFVRDQYGLLCTDCFWNIPEPTFKERKKYFLSIFLPT